MNFSRSFSVVAISLFACHDLFACLSKKLDSVAMFEKVEKYRCVKSSNELGQIFDEDLSKPGSVKVTKSDACVVLAYEKESSPIPFIFVEDKITGYELFKDTNSGNSKYKTFLISAEINEGIVRRFDFDLEKSLGHLTMWKLGWFKNKMLYNYFIECKKIE